MASMHFLVAPVCPVLRAGETLPACPARSWRRGTPGCCTCWARPAAATLTSWCAPLLCAAAAATACSSTRTAACECLLEHTHPRRCCCCFRPVIRAPIPAHKHPAFDRPPCRIEAFPRQSAWGGYRCSTVRARAVSRWAYRCTPTHTRCCANRCVFQLVSPAPATPSALPLAADCVGAMRLEVQGQPVRCGDHDVVICAVTDSWDNVGAEVPQQPLYTAKLREMGLLA